MHIHTHRQPVGQVTPRECPHRPTSFQGESLPRTRTGRQSWKQDTTLSALHTNLLKLLHFLFLLYFKTGFTFGTKYPLIFLPSFRIGTFICQEPKLKWKQCQNRCVGLGANWGWGGLGQRTDAYTLLLPLPLLLLRCLTAACIQIVALAPTIGAK